MQLGVVADMRLIGCEKLGLSVKAGLRKNEQILDTIFFPPVPRKVPGK